MIIYVLESALNTFHELCLMLRGSSFTIPCCRWGTRDMMRLRNESSWGSGFDGLSVEPMPWLIVLERLSDPFTLLLQCIVDFAQSCTLLWWYCILWYFFCLVSKVFFFLVRNFLMWYELSVKVSFRVALFILRICFFCHWNSGIDVAIGAPQEDDLRGAVYIYNGRADGISSSFSQVEYYCFQWSIDKKWFLKLPALMGIYFS